MQRLPIVSDASVVPRDEEEAHAHPDGANLLRPAAEEEDGVGEPGEIGRGEGWKRVVLHKAKQVAACQQGEPIERAQLVSVGR